MAKTKKSTIIRRILKFLGALAAIVILLFGVASWVVFERKDDWLVNQIQSYLKQSQSGQLEIQSIDLKLFRNFPDITVELDSIKYYEHRDTLRAPGEKPILLAERLSVSLGFWPLIHDELKISEFKLSNARLNIVEYKSGSININLALAPPEFDSLSVTTTSVDSTKQFGPAVQIDLEFIHMDNVEVTWRPFSARRPTVVLIKDLASEFSQDGKTILAKLFSKNEVQHLYINGVSMRPGDLEFQASIQYDLLKQYLTIGECKINYNVFSGTLIGSYDHKKNQSIDIQLDAKSNNLGILSRIVKPEILRKNPGLLKKGDVYVKGRIMGELKNSLPQFDISFGVKKLSLKLPDKLGAFDGIGFEGSLASGKAQDYSEARFEINNLQGRVPGGYVKGNLRIINFIEPHLTYQFATELDLDGYDQIFELNFLNKLKGTVSLQTKFTGPLALINKHGADSSRSSSITLNNLSFVLAKTNQQVSGLSAHVESDSGQTIIRDLNFLYGKNDFHINASVDNFYHFLLDQESPIIASGTLRSSQLFTSNLIFDTLLSVQVKDRVSNLAFNFQVKTSPQDSTSESSMPNISFDIQKLSASFDKLPNIKLLNTRGRSLMTTKGFKLELDKFQATMPQGQLELTGDLMIPENRLWEFNAHLKTNQFPWTYVQELIAEINDGSEPSSKNVPVKQMELFTTDLDLTAAITTYPFDIHTLQIRNSPVQFYLPGSKTISTENLNLSLENLHFKHEGDSGALTGLKSTKGKLAFEQLHLSGVNPFNIEMNVSGKDDTLDIDFTSHIQNAGRETGKLLLDISKKETVMDLHYSVKDASLEYFIRKYYKKKLMTGDIDYTLDFRITGSTWAKAIQSLSGEIEIEGDSLMLYGMDIDNILKKFRKSQNFNLTDVGAVLIAGPVGLAVTKGSDFISLASISLDSTHQTGIRKLFAKWKLKDRLLSTEDVAIATYKNRIAFDGTVDLVRDSIPGFTIAVVDKNGCSLMDQKLYGKMGALKQGKLNITETVLGSVINFFNAVAGKDCKPIYNGKVKAIN